MNDWGESCFGNAFPALKTKPNENNHERTVIIIENMNLLIVIAVGKPEMCTKCSTLVFTLKSKFFVSVIRKMEPIFLSMIVGCITMEKVEMSSKR